MLPAKCAPPVSLAFDIDNYPLIKAIKKLKPRPGFVLAVRVKREWSEDACKHLHRLVRAYAAQNCLGTSNLVLILNEKDSIQNLNGDAMRKAGWMRIPHD